MNAEKLFYLPLSFGNYITVARETCTSANRIIQLTRKSREHGGAWVEFTSQGDTFKLMRRADGIDFYQVNL